MAIVPPVNMTRIRPLSRSRSNAVDAAALTLFIELELVILRNPPNSSLPDRRRRPGDASSLSLRPLIGDDAVDSLRIF